MKKINHSRLAPIISLVFLFYSSIANAGLITSTLGNSSSGLVSGTQYALPSILNAQAGNLAPFINEWGGDDPLPFLPPPIEDPVTWTFNYGPIADTILSAQISFGIWDVDSAASGSQLTSFNLDGSNATSSLDSLFEAESANNAEYSVFTLNLTNSQLANLADGLFDVTLDIGGNGLIDALFPSPGVQESIGNGYRLIFSSLTIVTDDATTVPNPITEPHIIALFLMSLLSIRALNSRQ